MLSSRQHDVQTFAGSSLDTTPQLYSKNSKSSKRKSRVEDRIMYSLVKKRPWVDFRVEGKTGVENIAELVKKSAFPFTLER